MRHRSIPWAVLLLVVVAASCARREITGVEVGGLDRKLSTFAFVEEGRLATVVVDVRSTRDRGEAPYMPLEIAIANLGLRNITLTRESFTLVDEEGNRYPCVGPRDLMQGYEYLDMDRRLGELPGILDSRFAAFTRYSSMFSPVRDAENTDLVRDRVSLPKFGYVIDFVYFPTPPNGVLNHRFELFVDAPELSDPIFVKFVVL